MQSKKIIKTAAVLLLWVAIWQLAAILINQEIIIPSPIRTLEALFELAKTGQFYLAVLKSLFRILFGYILGVTFGFFGAVLSHRSPLFSAIFSPVLKIIRAVPVASFIIVVYYSIQSNELPIFICFLMVLPMVWADVENSLKNIDLKYLEVAKIYKLSTYKTFLHIKLPFILPSFISTSITALGFAWKSGIAAEIICTPDFSLGGLIEISKRHIEMADVFALTVVVALLSIIIEAIIKFVVRRFTYVKNQ
jgi:NitT/TauT family transport system permease protein